MIDVSKNLYSNKTLKELRDIPKIKGLPTGIHRIDENFGFPVGFYAIVGNPGTGKSWFALWLSKVFWELSGKTSVMFSLEMPEHAVRKRILQAWSGLTYSEYLKDGDTSKATNMLSEDMFITDTFFEEDQSKQTPENFELLFAEYYSLGYRIFHFDHLHEVKGATGESNKDVIEEWGELFKKLRKKYPDTWIIVFVQPNAASAKKKLLKRTDMLGSKAITYKCDYFLSLNRVKAKTEELIEIEDEDRDIILWIDKTRYTEKTHIGFRLVFEETGNFADTIANWLS